MGDSNIIHQYFRKDWEGGKILVRVNPIHLRGIELQVSPSGEVTARELEFDEQIFDDLTIDGFAAGSALEFNLHAAGLA